MVRIKLGRYEAQLYIARFDKNKKGIIPELKNSSRQSYSKEFSSTETLNSDEKFEIFWCKG